MIMDIGRGTYEAPARFTSGPGGGGVLVWELAQPGALPFPFGHAFGASVWEGDHRKLGLGMGELSRAGKRIRPRTSPHPGTHFHGDPQWFSTGVPPEIMSLPPPILVCGTPTVNAVGGAGVGGSAAQGRVVAGRGGAGIGGVAVQGSFPALLSAGGGGVGGAAHQGTAPATYAIGGAGVGGSGWQSGGPGFLGGPGGAGVGGSAGGVLVTGRGGAGVGGSAGGVLITGDGGAGVGGAAEQGPGPPDVFTECCGATPLPRLTHYTFSGSADPAGNVSVELGYDDVNEQWESGPFTLGTEDGYTMAVRCTSTFWQVQIDVDGGPFILLITFVADCGPPHEMVWTFVTGSWPGLSPSGPTTGTWTP